MYNNNMYIFIFLIEFALIFEIVLLCLRLMCDIFYFVLALFGGLCIVCCFLFLILIFRV